MSSEQTPQKTKFSDKVQFQLLIRYISQHQRLFFVVMFMMLLNVGMGMVGPLIINFIISIVEKGQQLSNTSVAYQAIFVYGIFTIASWLAGVIQMVFVAKLNARFIRDLRTDAFANLIKNKIPFFDDQKSGDLTSRIINDTRELSDSANAMAWVTTSIVRLAFVLGIFIYFSPILSLAAIGFLPIVILISVVLGRYERKVSAVWREKFGEVNTRFHEIMSKIAISKAFNREKENLARFEEINEATYNASVKRGFAIFIFWPITDLMKHVLTILFLAVGVWQVQQGMPIATLVLFLVLINYYYWPLITIANNYHRFQGAFASLTRIAKIAYSPELTERNEGSLQPNHLDGNIEFRNMTFGYSEDLSVLKEINFSIKSGQRVALVGHTGAGKSTIASLLLRFYEVDKDTIVIDNHSIEEYELENYRSLISLVSQKVLLFQGTIRENLSISSDLTDDKIWEVLDMVEAREFIEALPDGLDTMVEENGKNLSAGQKQMLSFARALLADSDIIILDEATSAVDLYTEAKIQDAIDILLESRTSITIAHRLTTILKSDLIVVLDQGRIVQIGDHDQLLTEDGIYAEMYNLYMETQSAKYLTTIKR